MVRGYYFLTNIVKKVLLVMDEVNSRQQKRDVL